MLFVALYRERQIGRHGASVPCLHYYVNHTL
jgi:hypothetical protein